MKKTVLLGFALAAGCSGPQVETTELELPFVASFRESADPALTTDPATGDLLLAWVARDSGEFDLYHARSSDHGRSWSPPARVTTQSGLVRPQAEASPRLLAHNGVLALFWPTSIDVPGRRHPASNLRFSRSTDGGRTWSESVILNDDTASVLAGHTFHGATATGDSTFVVAWLDSRAPAKASADDPGAPTDGNATVYTAQSDDLGASWAARNTKLWSAACPCCRVSLAGAPDGGIHASWRAHLEGSVRDPVVGRIGETIQEPVRVHEDGWVFPGCPHTGPALAVDADGIQHVAWFTGKEAGAGVYYARSRNESFDAPVPILTGTALQTGHPAISLLPAGGAVVAVNLGESGERVLTIAHISPTNVVSRFEVAGSDGSDHPQLATAADGSVYVAWTDKSSGSRVRLVRIAGLPRS